jgi:hypothetical protein
MKRSRDMRHEITIPFCFDTTPIEQTLDKIGAEELEKAIRQLVERKVDECLPKTPDYGFHDVKTNWKLYLDGKVTEWLDEHAEEIIDEAAMLMAERAARKRKWREVLKDIKEEQ